MDSVELEDTGIRPRFGFDAWGGDGRFRFRTLRMADVFRRRPAYFRVNQTGKTYRLISRWKTVEVLVGRRQATSTALTSSAPPR